MIISFSSFSGRMPDQGPQLLFGYQGFCGLWLPPAADRPQGLWRSLQGLAHHRGSAPEGRGSSGRVRQDRMQVED